MAYCSSRHRTIRRPATEVKVGTVGVGGTNPLRLQSMTTSDTQDVAATVRQSVALAEVGCEIVRVTAPNVAAARCLRDIRTQLTAAGFGHVPLVADIHFLPGAAMEAVEHVEKVRVNPGNYADRKKFAVREYTDSDYERELQRLHEAFSPLVRRAKELGRSLRIGTNHGSLSDRIMNRHGDTPLGMVESALEFVRICESHGFHDLILSMKASNPKVMIQAYRLLVARMDPAHRAYPLHLGVTEAGDGEDGRIKSAIGIGSLLLDGLGDTIRVSLTEDSVFEIPVARALADKAMSLWRGVPEAKTNDQGPMTNGPTGLPTGSIVAEVAGPGAGPAPSDRGQRSRLQPGEPDPYSYTRRATAELTIGKACLMGPGHPPRVVVRVAARDLSNLGALFPLPRFAETPAEGLLVSITSATDLAGVTAAHPAAAAHGSFLALELDPALTPGQLEVHLAGLKPGGMLVRSFAGSEGASLREFAGLARRAGWVLACAVHPAALDELAPVLRDLDGGGLLFTLAPAAPSLATDHALGAYRSLAAGLDRLGLQVPVWIRNTADTAIHGDPSFLSRLLDAAILTGALLGDGLGDLVSIETEADPARAATLAYNVLQGAGARSSKTEFVACPSCGRTLFDLQTTTQRIRARTGHLKGVKIAVMGCIVNGPGEMADADFGYVGGAPGKINLYVGRHCVQYNLPQAEADDRLVALIRAQGRWAEPAAPPSDSPVTRR